MKRRNTKKSTDVNAIGYVRYSTMHQGDNSIGRQCDAIERWAARSGAHLLAVYIDREVSRTKDHDERPGLMAAIDALKPGAVLVAENVSRYAGSPSILDGIRRAAQRMKARVTTADASGDDDLDEDRQDFEALFSKREIKNIRKRTKGALAIKKMRGELVGHPPFGFRRKADGEHVIQRGRRACAIDCAGCLHVEADPSEQGIIRQAVKLSDDGLSVRAIAAELAAAGHVGRKGKPLSHTQVHRILDRVLREREAV